jgi:hypothetical protein
MKAIEREMFLAPNPQRKPTPSATAQDTKLLLKLKQMNYCMNVK